MRQEHVIFYQKLIISRPLELSKKILPFEQIFLVSCEQPIVFIVRVHLQYCQYCTIQVYR